MNQSSDDRLDQGKVLYRVDTQVADQRSQGYRISLVAHNLIGISLTFSVLVSLFSQHQVLEARGLKDRDLLASILWGPLTPDQAILNTVDDDRGS